MSDTMEQYPAAVGGDPAAGMNPAAVGEQYPAAAGMNPAAVGEQYPAAAGGHPDDAVEYTVTCSTPFMNCVFGLVGWERIAFIIFMAICFLVAVAFMIMKLVEEGEWENKHG